MIMSAIEKNRKRLLQVQKNQNNLEAYQYKLINSSCISLLGIGTAELSFLCSGIRNQICIYLLHIPRLFRCGMWTAERKFIISISRALEYRP